MLLTTIGIGSVARMLPQGTLKAPTWRKGAVDSGLGVGRLAPVCGALVDWSDSHLEEVRAARSRYHVKRYAASGNLLLGPHCFSELCRALPKARSNLVARPAGGSGRNDCDRVHLHK